MLHRIPKEYVRPELPEYWEKGFTEVQVTYPNALFRFSLSISPPRAYWADYTVGVDDFSQFPTANNIQGWASEYDERHGTEQLDWSRIDLI